MRVATLQFAPKLGCVEVNVARADSLLASSTAPLDNLDLLVLPELAFTGYNHPSLSSILPLLEPTSSGPSTQWALRTARRLNCLVTVGYPELFSASPPPVHTLKPTMIDLGSDDVADYYKVTAYNSTVTVDGEGKVMAHYRKRFLWYADEVWAQEGGEGFETAELEFPVRDSNPPSTHHLSSTVTTSDHRSTDEEEEPDPQSSSALPLPPSRTTKHKTTFAICMDLNTHHFSPSPPSPSSPLEVTHPLAAHILSSRTTLLVLSTAWLTNLPTTALRSDPQEPDWDTVKFWVERLSPLLSPQESPGEKGEREIICVFANRCGEEDGKLRYDEPGEWEAGEGVRYAGSSWIGKIAVGKGEVFMGGVLGRGEEGVCGFDSEGMGGKRGWRLRLREG